MESQISGNAIKDLEALGFKISWTLLKFGYEGIEFLPKQISMDAICQYAESLIIAGRESDLSVQLTIADDENEFCEILDRLVKAENVDSSLEQRKWRVRIVGKALDELTDDCFNGLLGLGDLWASLGFPDDCPHIFQSRSQYTPEEYYTPEKFDELLSVNKQWVESEIDSIKVAQND
jgi:hypothetical protein